MLIPDTSTRTGYAFTLYASRQGRAPVPIGTLQSVRFGQSRTVDDEYEVEANAVGLPADLVPQTLNRREITFSRFDTYRTILEEVFGSPEINTIIDQARPLVIREVWSTFPTFSDIRAYQYFNVFMTDMSREVRVDASRIVGTDVTFKWGYRLKVI